MNKEKLISMAEQEGRVKAVKAVMELYDISLKEADEYFESIISNNETKLKTKRRKSNILKVALIAIPIALASLFFYGVHSSSQNIEEYSKFHEEWNKELYGPADYKEAYLMMVHDSTIDSNKVVELYIELRKQEIDGVPFKQTNYWKDFKLKKQ